MSLSVDYPSGLKITMLGHTNQSRLLDPVEALSFGKGSQRRVDHLMVLL